MDSLLCGLRKKGFFYVDQVDTAILETDGIITVLAKPPHLTATQKDFFNIQANRGVPQAFIIDGQVLPNSLKMLGKDMDWVKQVLKDNNIASIKEVFLRKLNTRYNLY